MPAAERARAVIGQAIEVLQTFPFSCRIASPENPFLREWVISFGRGGYVALFEVDDAETVTVVAMRHQREDNYH